VIHHLKEAGTQSTENWVPAVEKMPEKPFKKKTKYWGNGVLCVGLYRMWIGGWCWGWENKEVTTGEGRGMAGRGRVTERKAETRKGEGGGVWEGEREGMSGGLWEGGAGGWEWKNGREEGGEGRGRVMQMVGDERG